jgi:S-DNA-T family DNA segregation ATPase FtsK/SpoIIIE
MAAKSKKGKTTKKTTQKTNSKTRKKTNKKTNNRYAEQSFVYEEIAIWGLLAFSILMLISNFGLGGFVGEAISTFLFKIFGLVAYLFPFIFFGIITFCIANKGNRIAYVKSTAGLCLMVLICTFLQLVFEKGGSLGNILVRLLVPAIGIWGTYVVVLILFIICLVVITGKSALKGVQTQSGRAYARAKQDAARRRELSETRRLERQQAESERNAERARKAQRALEKQRQEETVSHKRSDHKVDGVSFNTTLGKKKPDIKEINIEPLDQVAEEVIPAHADMSDLVINRGGNVSAERTEESQGDPSDNIREKSQKSRSKTKLSQTQAKEEVAEVAAAVEAGENEPKKEYKFPPVSLLKRGKSGGGESDKSVRETAMKLQKTLQTFGVNVTVTNVSCGPSVTRYELQPEMGVKVSKIVGLADDIKLNLAAADIRIEAPIPGKAAVGIEVPNKTNSSVMFRDLLESPEFQKSESKISFAVGKDIAGKVVVTDIAKMPHLLIAGATGSGKSVCINTLIMSILYKATPDEVKLIMIDPKVVELSVYNGIPHLMIPVVTDPKKAAGALNWAVAEMTRRYQAFAEYNVRDIKGYNEKIRTMPQEEGKELKKMPQIVVIVDELADLMMVAPGDVEEAICRLAQLARAAGIHLVLATQRPSVNVITGLIKANMPSRIAFSVSSGVDSRTIIDMNGAEKLLGKGDMLFYPSGYQKPARVQGSFVTDKEIQDVVDFLKNSNGDVTYDEEVVSHVNTAQLGGGSGITSSEGNERDMYFVDAGRLIIDKDKASIGMLQRTFKIGFNRAARIMDQLFEAGVVGPEEGTKARKVLMTESEFEQYVSDNI